jgi:GntR family transcriptional regulator
MTGVLTKTDGVSLYIQIRETLREQIKQGVFEAGAKLPSEDELATQFGVSRMTVRQGITDLIDEGVLYRRRGVGTFVAQFHVERDHNKLSSFFDTAKTEGFDFEFQVLNREVVPAKLMVAKALALQEGEPVIRIQTLRLANSAPVTMHDEYVPYRLCPDLLQDDLGDRHIWEVVESYGYRVKHAVQKVEARTVDSEVAQVLKMEEGAPILYKQRTILAEDGTPVEFTLCYNRGDMYSLTMTLSR